MCVCVCTCDVVMENLPNVVMIDLESVAAIDDTGEVLIIVVCGGASVGDTPDPMT